MCANTHARAKGGGEGKIRIFPSPPSFARACVFTEYGLVDETRCVLRPGVPFVNFKKYRIIRASGNPILNGWNTDSSREYYPW